MDEHNINNSNQPEIDELTNEKYIMGHEYDNIRELDNRLPRWWIGLFLLTILFSVIYIFRYHILHSADLQSAEYKNEMAAAAKANPGGSSNFDVNTLTVLKDEAGLAKGKEIFLKICATCHGNLGEGKEGLGPNMTDPYWLHGNTIKDMYKVVVDGVPGTAMVSFKAQFSPEQIQQVLSFIISLQGTNPPNPKAPQGAKYDTAG